MTKEQLLKLRKEMKKPAFVVKESNFNAGVKVRWRFPRGRHSKVRQMHCGRPAMPNPGYGAPAAVRGLHDSGLEMVLVHNLGELQSLDQKTQGAVIASSVGTRKRVSLLEAAQQKNIALLNVKDAGATAKKLVSEFEQRKEVRKRRFVEAGKKEEQKKKKSEEIKKSAEEKKKVEEAPDAEMQAKKEHDMMEKTVTKRQ
ncbi:MAG: eL32 family ribosomal protein [Nanoarchaeota archaeon]